MGETTAISWTDHTFNPWWGCTKVSPGCDHCYADTFAARPIHKRPDGTTGALDVWGKGKPRRVFDDKHWNEPLAWDRAAQKSGKPAMVFCASMADVMDDEAPPGQRERLWRLIDSTPNLIWQLLTKRPQRFERYLPARFIHRNAILMTTTENQEFYDIRWPFLNLARYMTGLSSGVSYEPALGPLTLMGHEKAPDWIIFGGESGAHRRPCEREWADNLLKECRERGVKFFVKQMSARTPTEGKALIPADLLIQEFPKA